MDYIYFLDDESYVIEEKNMYEIGDTYADGHKIIGKEIYDPDENYDL